jgi:TonB dependent receptor-like, beta-barrel
VLTLGASVNLELPMTLAGVQAEVTVVGGATVVDTQNAAVSKVIDEARIDALPTNGRNFIAFSLITPGVTTDQTPQQGASRTSGLTFAGQRARSNNITVDGLDNNDETVGSVRAVFSQEAVKEFQVVASSFPAEFGKAAGGLVNIVTKSGTNTYAGNVFGYFRDRSLNAKGYFEQFDPAGQAITQPKAPFNQKQFGGTFGGPIQRNRSFFFVSFERLDTLASNFVTIDDQNPVMNPLNPSVVFGTPAQILRKAGFVVDTGNVPYDLVLNQFLAKGDLQLAPTHSVSLRFNTATELNENIEPFGGLVARSRAAALDSTDVMGAASDALVVSDRIVNELRGQVALRNQNVRSLDPACGGPCLDESQGGPTLEVTGVASVGRQRFTPSLRDNVRYQVLDTASYYRGPHEFKTGLDVSVIRGRRQSLPLHFGGRYIFQNASLPLVPNLAPIPVSAIQEVALGLPIVYVQGYGFSGAAYNTSDLSVFAQDRWRLGSTLSLQFGVRYQRQFWADATYQPAGYPGAYNFPSDTNNFAPRVAVAWDPRNDNKTSVHGAYGVFYDNLITSAYGISKYINGTDGVRTLVLIAPGAFAAWASPGHRLTEAAALQLAGGRFPSVAITIDPALKTPYAHHVAFGVDRVLPDRTSLAVNVVFVRGSGQLGTIDYNPILPDLGPGRRPADVNGVRGTSASVLQYTSFGQTWYRGITASFDRFFGRRWQLLASYTLSKAEDTSTDFQSAFLPQTNGRGRNPADPNGLPIGFNPDEERGPTVEDQRHRLVISGSYIAPQGIQVSGILTAGSGRPYNILAGTDLNGDGDGGSSPSDRARAVPNDPATSVVRNSGTLPAQATLDLRVTRRFPVGGSGGRQVTIEPIFEVFNLFNRANFTGVQNVFGAGSFPASPLPTFGQFTQAGPPRQAQLAVKVTF